MLVVDASVALAWMLPEEQHPYAVETYQSLISGESAVVPALWPLEVVNTLQIAIRRKRILLGHAKLMIESLHDLIIEVEPAADFDNMQRILEISQEHQLTAYDAAYLDLAMRHGAALATLDKKLARACKENGVALFKG